MKQQGRRAARTECVIRKRLKLLKKAYLLCIILSWLGWSKVKRALTLVFYYKILSFTHLVLAFLPHNPSLTSSVARGAIAHPHWHVHQNAE